MLVVRVGARALAPCGEPLVVLVHQTEVVSVWSTPQEVGHAVVVVVCDREDGPGGSEGI